MKQVTWSIGSPATGRGRELLAPCRIDDYAVQISVGFVEPKFILDKMLGDGWHIARMLDLDAKHILLELRTSIGQGKLPDLWENGYVIWTGSVKEE